VHHEVSASALEFDERLPPESSDEASGARDVEGVERVTNRHEEVEPHLCPWSDEDGAATASSPHQLGTEGGCRGLVDRSEGLRAPEHHGGPIRITKGRKAARRLRDDDELAGS
jgi:hypothetical protein